MYTHWRGFKGRWGTSSKKVGIHKVQRSLVVCVARVFWLWFHFYWDLFNSRSLRTSLLSQSKLSHPVLTMSNHSAGFQGQCHTVVTVQSGAAPLVSSLWNLRRRKPTCLTGFIKFRSHFVLLRMTQIMPTLYFPS